MYVRFGVDTYTEIRICLRDEGEKCCASVPVQNVVRSDTIAVAKLAGLWRDMCLRNDRHAAGGAAKSVASPGSFEARRVGGSAP